MNNYILIHFSNFHEGGNFIIAPINRQLNEASFIIINPCQIN